ncbi:hypothetical protein C0J52_21715 [Blattella germanica]|nr:hypothetical protein C0J52_21715 [Blattella germanica]
MINLLCSRTHEAADVSVLCKPVPLSNAQPRNVTSSCIMKSNCTPLVCIRSQRRARDFEVRTQRLYPSQVQVYPGKDQLLFNLLMT